MTKKLPEMFHNDFSKNINNNTKYYSSLDKSNGVINKDIKSLDRFSIEKKIFSIFNSSDYIYKADVTIVTDTGSYNKRIVGKNANNLITIDNEYIPIAIIRDIYKN